MKPLPATVEISDGRLTIAAGSMEIGSWLLTEVHFEEIPTGYRMAAEGEHVIIELKDIDGFNVALRNGGKRRRRRGRKRTEAQKTEAASPSRAAPGNHRPASSPAIARGRDDKPSGWTSKGLAFVDGTLERANKRFGPYLPDWVFTRAMFAIAFGALILAIVLPTLVSTFLLIAGVLMVTFGAVVYSDPMLASRWLPGRTTPQHVLLFGVAILMMGVLLGVIAR